MYRLRNKDGRYATAGLKKYTKHGKVWTSEGYLFLAIQCGIPLPQVKDGFPLKNMRPLKNFIVEDLKNNKEMTLYDFVINYVKSGKSSLFYIKDDKLFCK